MSQISRREVVAHGTAAIAALSVLQSRLAQAFPLRESEVVVPWFDKVAENADPNGTKQLLVWEDFDSFITPNDRFFGIAHFNWPEIDPAAWKLEVGGLVRNPMSITLDDIKARLKKEVVFTLECSGNSAFPDFIGGIGTSRWSGTPLAAVLEEAGIEENGIEVVFWGADAGDIELKDAIRDVTMHQNFARSMSIEDAMSPDNLLCYEMNGAELPALNGFPLRLIAPGWYGIANVKWLTRIEVRDRRFMNRFMARDYVTIREEEHDGKMVWSETSVGRARLKSAPARVTRIGSDYRIVGVAWGAPVAKVEVKIDDGHWMAATIDESERADFAWKIWSLDWPNPAPGQHSVTSRSIGGNGQIQPAMDDPLIAKKHTYWEANGQITRQVVVD
jgi:DMSO/TMAO reductase YedYZ molybdopterin-dependent catalytic subunit